MRIINQTREPTIAMVLDKREEFMMTRPDKPEFLVVDPTTYGLICREFGGRAFGYGMQALIEILGLRIVVIPSATEMLEVLGNAPHTFLRRKENHVDDEA